MRYACVVALMFLFPLMISGCGSSSESDRDWMNVSPMDSTATAPRTFETRTDTVQAQSEQHPSTLPSTTTSATGSQYTVQIGAFKDAKLAGAAQALARKRYQLPAVNDYNTQRRRYQVRIGFFDTLEEANQFCAKLRKEFAAEYKHAWVVQLNK
jgi:cell division septation protein DedD